MQGLQQKFGFVPNVAATMAESPVLLNAFVGCFVNFQGSGFNDMEKQTLLLTNAVTMQSPWTIAFHSTMALQAGVSQGDVRAIREGKPPKDAHLAALRELTKALIETKGRVSEAEIEKFLLVGYSKTCVLEVVAGLAISTMAATVGNLARTPIEETLQMNA
ncbi:MAG: carboxymuconolactone decarboxylase family protein [Pleurocapsa sp. SU_196_0]|nr:carboxymuconolactone decarboxylase family protein [Pleurocapsa sp. SU_196_0]